jgi:anti-anti-sigma factor
MSELKPVPFHNKILICDIVAYSKRDPLEQQKCHGVLTDVVLRALDDVGGRLHEDVIALPTGDGVALNFKKDEPDIHLRTALVMLEFLDEHNREAEERLELRIGLNTHVDSIVVDVNGKENIVGTGINLARRVMDLGSHGQVLLHRSVWEDLRNYEQYQGSLRNLGEFAVKHDQTVPLAQYVDAARAYLSDAPPAAGTRKRPKALNLSQIRKERIAEELVSVELTGADRDGIDDVVEYAEDYLEATGAVQGLKIAVVWAAREMLDNVFRHGKLAANDRVSFSIELTKHGVLIATGQPLLPDFDLKQVMTSREYRNHFLYQMRKRGMRIFCEDEEGVTQIACEVPKQLVLGGDANKLRLLAGLPRTHEVSFRAATRDIWVVRLAGRIAQQGADELQRGAEDVKKAGVTRLALDCRELHYGGSRMLGYLVNLVQACESGGGMAVMVEPAPSFRHTLDLTGLAQIFKIVPDLEAALAMLREGPRAG